MWSIKTPSKQKIQNTFCLQGKMYYFVISPLSKAMQLRFCSFYLVYRLFMEILNDCTDVDEIKFQEDGSWCPMRPKKEAMKVSSQPCPKIESMCRMAAEKSEMRVLLSVALTLAVRATVCSSVCSVSLLIITHLISPKWFFLRHVQRFIAHYSQSFHSIFFIHKVTI